MLLTPLVLWGIGATLACLISLYQFSAVLVDGQFIPADHDSFYHAHRILAALAAPLSVMQFDPAIHAPEGSWLTWPWAYDAMMAAITSAVMRLTGSTDPMRILVFIAPAWVFVNAAFMLAIGRCLELRPALLAVMMTGFAVSPLTRALHRVGMLDHHFIEYAFVLAVLWRGLRWCADLQRPAAAAWCGIVLGAAPAFHNGLFILQLPVLATGVVLWCLNRRLPPTAIAAFALALVATSIAFLLFSEPFRSGEFSFYLHSWFHLYIALCSALVMTTLARLPRRASSVIVLALGGAVLTLPILAQIDAGSGFLTGTLIEHDKLFETHSPWRWIAAGQAQTITELYGGVIWLLPMALLGLAWQTRRHSTDRDLFLLIMCAFGAILLSDQYRMHYFGSFALLLPWLVILERTLRKKPDRQRRLIGGCAALLILLHVPSLHALGRSMSAGSDFQYMLLRGVYLRLGAACARAPGLVLAEHGDGHYITYHSQCAVIANNFILTRQHEMKIERSEYLLSLTPAQVMREAPQVRYILARRADNVLSAHSCYPRCAENAGLRATLLAPEAPNIPGLRLLAETYIKLGRERTPLARLYQIVPTSEP